MTRDELMAIIDDLGEELTSIRNELAKTKRELEWAHNKLIEAQERNRRLDWCLTRTTEELR